MQTLSIELRDFLEGSVELPLDQLPLAFSKSRKIKGVDCLAERKTSSLFDQRQMYGWWPVFGELKNKEGKKEKSLMVSLVDHVENNMLRISQIALMKSYLNLFVKVFMRQNFITQFTGFIAKNIKIMNRRLF